MLTKWKIGDRVWYHPSNACEPCLDQAFRATVIGPGLHQGTVAIRLDRHASLVGYPRSFAIGERVKTAWPFGVLDLLAEAAK